MHKEKVLEVNSLFRGHDYIVKAEDIQKIMLQTKKTLSAPVSLSRRRPKADAATHNRGEALRNPWTDNAPQSM